MNGLYGILIHRPAKIGHMHADEMLVFNTLIDQCTAKNGGSTRFWSRKWFIVRKRIEIRCIYFQYDWIVRGETELVKQRRFLI